MLNPEQAHREVDWLAGETKVLARYRRRVLAGYFGIAATLHLLFLEPGMGILDHIALAIFILLPGIAPCLVVWAAIRRRASREWYALMLRSRIHDATAKILADGKIEGPKGVYRPRRWAPKWLHYIGALPGPKASKVMTIPEMPRHPHAGE